MPSRAHERVVALLSPFVRAAGLSFEARQAGFASAAAELFPAVPTDVEIAAVDAGGVPAEWVAAPGARRPRTVLYLHGGGYTQGSPATHRELASRVSRRAAARALSIDYRLAPDHPFPAAVDDALAAYRWLTTNVCPAKSIAVVGDSAGGGLTVAMLLALRDAGERLPACGVCMSPWLDLKGASESARADDDPIVERQHMLDVAATYLAGASDQEPLASPLYGSPQGLPPLLLQVGGRELLVDDSRRFAERARKAGVEVELEVWDGLTHVWQIWGDELPEARQALEQIGGFIKGRIPI